MFEGIDKQTWYRWSIILNVILFFIVAFCIFLLVRDSMYHRSWELVTRDIAFLAIALSFIFYQFFINLRTIIKRKL